MTRPNEERVLWSPVGRLIKQKRADHHSNKCLTFFCCSKNKPDVYEFHGLKRTCNIKSDKSLTNQILTLDFEFGSSFSTMKMFGGCARVLNWRVPNLPKRGKSSKFRQWSCKMCSKIDGFSRTPRTAPDVTIQQNVQNKLLEN